ncbi:MAG: hypothetical protein R3E84_04080 [Pseudomonadales bacterium]
MRASTVMRARKSAWYLQAACAATGSCEVFTTDAVPSKDYTGLVDVAASNVIVRNLVIRDSASIPLVLKSNAETGGTTLCSKA